MSTRKQSFASNEFYHLYNRGTDKRIIFKDKTDYKHFLYLMYVCNTSRSVKLKEIGKNFDRKETLIEVGAYCLMPNHFHILVKEKLDGNISKYMLKLMTAYSMYFNKKYERTGKLYEGTFKSTHANTDQYLKYLYSYIHLNPAKLIDKNWKEGNRKNSKNLLEYISAYSYSSIYEYKNNKFYIVHPKSFPEYFIGFIEHKSELFSWLDFTP